MAFNFLRRDKSHETGMFGDVEVLTASYQEPQSETASYQEPVDLEPSMYTKTIKVLLYVAAFLLPLFFLPWTTGATELNKQMLLVICSGVGLILWLVNIVSQGRLSWRSNPLEVAVISFLGAATLSTIFSLAKFKSIFGTSGSSSSALITMVALTVFYFLAVNVIEAKGKFLKKLLAGSFALALLYGLLQMLGLTILGGQFASRSFTTVGSLNTLGILAGLALPFYSKLKINEGWARYLFLDKVGIILSLAILVILNWWVLWAVAISGMVALIILENMRAVKFKMSRFLLPMTVIVLGVFLAVVGFNISGLKNNFPIEVAPSYSLTSKVSLSALKDNLIFGYGPENFSIAFDKYGAKSLADTTLSSVKFADGTSEALNMIVHGGLVGVLAFLFLVWSFIWGVFKAKRQIHADESGEAVAMISLAFAGLVGLFLYPFNISLMFVFFVALALMTLALWGDFRRVYNVEEKAWLSMVASLGFIVGLIVVLVGAYYGVAIYLADAKYAQAVTILNKPDADIQKAADKLSEAINWNGLDDRYFRSGSQVALGLLNKEINRTPEKNEDQQARTTKIQNLETSAVNLARQATIISPKESNNWVNLGGVYQSLMGLIDGVDKFAAESYAKGIELRPDDASYYLNLGNVYMAKSDIANQLVQAGGAQAEQAKKDSSEALLKAEEVLKKAVDISGNYGLAIYNLGIVYDREGKTGEAIKQLEKVAPANTNQPGLFFELGLLYYRDNQKDKAIGAMQQAILLSPEYANARWYLASIYEERKEYDLAIEQLEKILAVEANKDNETVKTKLQALLNARDSNVKTPVNKAIDQKPL